MTKKEPLMPPKKTWQTNEDFHKLVLILATLKIMNHAL